MGYRTGFAVNVFFKPLAVLAVLSLLAIPLPSVVGHPNTVEAAPAVQIPPGQLKRKSLSGTVVAVSASLITVGTRFGNVDVNVTGRTVINVGPEKNVGIDRVQVGDKVAVKLDRSIVDPELLPEPDAPTESETSTEPVGESQTSTDSVTGETSTEPVAPSTTTTDVTTDNGTSTPPATGEQPASDTATSTDSGTSTAAVRADAILVSPEQLSAALVTIGGGGFSGLVFRGAAQATTTDDGTSAQTTTDDGAGAQTTTDDGTGTQTTTDDGTGTQTTTGDGTGTGTTTDDGTGTQTTTEDDATDGSGASSTGVGQLPSFRTVTALRITVVPSKATISHQRGLETCKTKGKRTVVNDDGEEVELDDESTDQPPDGSVSTSTLTALLDTVGGGGFGSLSLRGVGLQATGTEDGGDGSDPDAGSIGTTTTTTNGTTTDADGSGGTSTSTDSSVDESTCEGDGDRVILLLQKQSLRSEKAVIRASQRAAKIDERLARLADKLEVSGKTDLLTKLTAKAEERKTRDQERLDRTLARADEKTKAAIDRAKNRGKKQTDDAGGGATDGSTGSKGKPEDKGKGKPEDKDKGKGKK